MGPRTLVCSQCGHDFGMKAKVPAPVADETIKQAIQRIQRKVKVSRNKAVENHKILAPGDRIKILSGGSYIVNKDGAKIHIGYYGRFIVKGVDQNGIFAYGNKKEGEQAMCYIWMGRNLLSKAGVHRRAHKVVKLNG